MNEQTGCAVLKERFVAAGLAILDDYPLLVDEGAGLSLRVDGYDPERRIGFEYITTEAGDRQEVTPELIEALEARMRRAELFVLLVDEHDVLTPDDLRRAADGFLAKVAEHRMPGREPAP